LGAGLNMVLRWKEALVSNANGYRIQDNAVHNLIALVKARETFDTYLYLSMRALYPDAQGELEPYNGVDG
jgi:hypothetical protein